MLNNIDYYIKDQINETIQCMKFIPIKNFDFLATGDWDGQLRIFNINYNIINNNLPTETAQISSILESTIIHNSPIFSLSWEGNSGRIFTGCADGSINIVDIAKKSILAIGNHQKACKEVIYHEAYKILLTGGWDGVVNLFDLRQQNPLFSYKFENKVYTMSCAKDLFIVGLSENKIGLFNLAKLKNNNFMPELIFNSHLSHQTRKVCVFPNGNGYAIGSIEGRVAIKNIKDLNNLPKIDSQNGTLNYNDDFAFKCHRNSKVNPIVVYGINDIAFNTVYGTFCTVGSDGIYYIWDMYKKSKLLERDDKSDKTPLTACDYNSSGNLLAFSSGYDWSKGAEGAKEFNSGVKIGIHYLPLKERKKDS